MLSLSPSQFPSSTGLERARWAPLLLRPILGSPEQVVIGVAAVSNENFYLARAERLDRLECLLPGNSASAVLAANAALDALQADLAERSLSALSDFVQVFSGVSLGEIREADTRSVEDLAKRWLNAISSLSTSSLPLAPLALQASNEELELEEVSKTIGVDRLPSLVLDYVLSKRPSIDKFFRQDIRERRTRQRTPSAVQIDYAGSKIVANFGALIVAQHANSVLRITKAMWDLKIDRDREEAAFRRDHEMLVQHPPMNDPQFTQRQIDRIAESLSALEQQADQEEIRLRAMNTVAQIGDHLLAKEAA